MTQELSTPYKFTIQVEVAPYRVIGPVDGGELVFVEIVGGVVKGELEGVVLPGGGDWATFHDDGTVSVDARYQIQSSDGDIIDVRNTGIAHFTDSTRGAIDYFATRPQFRVSADRWRNLHRRVYIGWARSTSEATEIDVFEVSAPPAAVEHD